MLFAVNVVMVLHPTTFGLADASEAVRVCFFASRHLVGWLFAAALFVGRGITATARPPRLERNIGRLSTAHLDRPRYPAATHHFCLPHRLLAVHRRRPIPSSAWPSTTACPLGFDTNDLLIALGITQFVGFPAAIAFGWLGERIGTRKGIFIGLAVYIAATVWGYFLDAVWEFYALAVAVGLVQGGVQALSRSLYSRLIPRDRAAEFFGFLQHAGQIRRSHRPSARRLDWSTDRQPRA